MNFFAFNHLLARNEFRLIDKWSYDELFYGHFFGAVVTDETDLIVMFYKGGIKVANGKKNYDFATIGEGPNEVRQFSAICLYKDRVAEIELNRKIQIFKKSNGQYKWEKNIWREEKGCSQIVSSAVFTDGKWFLAGQEYDFRTRQKGTYHLLRVCDENGTSIKRFIRRDYEEPKRLNLMSFYVSADSKRVFFIAEDEPVVHVISQNTLTLMKKVKLEMPDFYVQMPNDFYSKEIKKNSEQFTVREFLSAVQGWKHSYSRITNAMIEDEKFVIQIRTCSEKLPRFALLFYNLQTFLLEETVFTNDFLLTSKSGKYYLFENGNPGIDDEAGDFVVNICELKKRGS